MDPQVLLVILIVGAAVVYLTRRASRTDKSGGGCGCGCGEGGCPAEKRRECSGGNEGDR